MELDEADKSILYLLQKNARLTNLSLASSIQLSPAATLERVRKLEKQQIITHYEAGIDPSKVGVPIQVFLAIYMPKVNKENINKFKAVIDQISQVNLCYQVMGTFDFLLTAQAESLFMLQEQILTKLYTLTIVDRIQVLYITQLVKKEPVYLK